MTNLYPGALLNIDDDGKGNVTATQESPTPLTGGPTESIPFDWSLGPVKLSGWVDLATFDVALKATVVGITIGDSIRGNLKDGVNIKLNILVATGAIKLYLKNGNDIWVNLNVKVTFDGTFQGDYKILTI